MTIDQGSITLLAAGCGVGGVILGHYLTRSWQLEQWRIDHRREEYRELISSLVAVYTNLHWYPSDAGGQMDLRLKIEASKADAIKVVRDRIIIAAEIDEIGALRLWYQAFRLYDSDRSRENWSKLGDAHEQLTKSLVEMALAPPPNAFRRMLGRLRGKFRHRR
jgi:hypothetical protein